MQDYQSLIHKLEYLQKSKTHTISLDVNWLLALLLKCPPNPEPLKITPLELHRYIDVDGGEFSRD
jgi:hypothetical protein